MTPQFRFANCACGQLIVICDGNPKLVLLPATLDNAGNFTRERQLPKTNAAELELSDKSAWPTATPATAAIADRKFLFCGFFRNSRSSSHPNSSTHCLNGIPNCFNNSLASSSVFALVTIVTFMPRILSTLA